MLFVYAARLLLDLGYLIYIYVWNVKRMHNDIQDLRITVLMKQRILQLDYDRLRMLVEYVP